jgi:hypothetical protein
MPAAHDVLGVLPNASPRELRRAFRRAVLALHPDRAGTAREAELLAAIAAYEELTGKVRPPRARRRATGPRRAAHGPPFVRDRFNCGGCGDTFAIDGECPRCALPLGETERPAHPVRPEVEAFEARLSAPPGWLGRTLARCEARIPVVALAGCFAFGTLAMGVHPPIALMSVGYGLALFLAEAWSGRACG